MFKENVLSGLNWVPLISRIVWAKNLHDPCDVGSLKRHFLRGHFPCPEGVPLMEVSLYYSCQIWDIFNVHFFNYRGRMGFVPILSLKVGLAVMCSEKVQEKYRCKFDIKVIN